MLFLFACFNYLWKIGMHKIVLHINVSAVAVAWSTWSALASQWWLKLSRREGKIVEMSVVDLSRKSNDIETIIVTPVNRLGVDGHIIPLQMYKWNEWQRMFARINVIKSRQLKNWRFAQTKSTQREPSRLTMSTKKLWIIFRLITTGHKC